MTRINNSSPLQEWGEVETSLASLFGVPNDKIHKILNSKQNHEEKQVISASLID